MDILTKFEEDYLRELFFNTTLDDGRNYFFGDSQEVNYSGESDYRGTIQPGVYRLVNETLCKIA